MTYHAKHGKTWLIKNLLIKNLLIKNLLIKNLLIKNLKLPKITTKITHCQNYHYGHCSECQEDKAKFCNENLIFKKIKQVTNNRWHLYFLCSKSHLVIRWIIKKQNRIIIGNLKN